jgi:hypothetical protein
MRGARMGCQKRWARAVGSGHPHVLVAAVGVGRAVGVSVRRRPCTPWPRGGGAGAGAGYVGVLQPCNHLATPAVRRVVEAGFRAKPWSGRGRNATCCHRRASHRRSPARTTPAPQPGGARIEASFATAQQRHSDASEAARVSHWEPEASSSDTTPAARGERPASGPRAPRVHHSTAIRGGQSPGASPSHARRRLHAVSREALRARA